MFYGPDQFPFVKILEDNWHVIRAELNALRDGQFTAWPEHSLYGEKGWNTFGLYAFGTREAQGCELCPNTDRLISQIPGLMMAGFSRLAPATRIVPHRGYEGYAGYVLRLHLALDIPPGCGIRVENETRTWEEGKCLIFDDSYEHEAWNQGDATRTVLLLDFINPLRKQPLLLIPQFTPELINFIESKHLPNQTWTQRLLWYVWKALNPRLVRMARQSVASDRPA